MRAIDRIKSLQHTIVHQTTENMHLCDQVKEMEVKIHNMELEIRHLRGQIEMKNGVIEDLQKK